MVGVGGVLLAPGLVAIAGTDPHVATATSTWAFLFTGVVGTVAYAWRRAVPWPMLGRLAVGLVPAAFIGATANALLPSTVVLLVLAALALLIGLQQLLAASGDGDAILELIEGARDARRRVLTKGRSEGGSERGGSE